MRNFLFLSDTHLSGESLDINKDIWGQAFDLCDKRGIKHIIHGGDVFDGRRSQIYIVIKTFQDILSDAERRGIKIRFLSGNHDKINTSSDESWVTLLCPNNDGDDAFYENHNIYFLDYYNEPLYLERLDQLSKRAKPKSMLFTHIGISDYYKGGALEHIHQCNISASHFTSFRKVFSGHYHSPKEFDNIIYTGSAFQSSFGDVGDRGFMLFERDNDGTWRYEWVKSRYKPYIVVHTEEGNRDEVRAILQATLGKDIDFNDIHLCIKSKLPLSNEEATFFMQYKAKIVLEMEQKNSNYNDQDINSGQDIFSILEKYCTAHTVPNKQKKRIYNQLKTLFN